LVASVLLPQFKLNFLPEDARLDIKRQVLDYIREVVAERTNTASQCGAVEPAIATTSSQTKEDEDEDLYSFMNYTEHDVAPDSNSLSKQLEDFLASKLTSIQMLKDYPLIAQAFLKANSTLPSSAAVERLFSVAGMILTPRRCKMSDKLFDKMVFLKGRSQ
jgi:hypothetical protein